LPWSDPALFSELMLSWEMRSYRIAIEAEGIHFFDRGVPDVMGYMRLTRLAVPGHVAEAVRQYRYNRKVFILPPWPEIFMQDSERKQTLEEALRTYRSVAAAYTGCGYELVEVPRMPVEDRARFVIAAAGIVIPTNAARE